MQSVDVTKDRQFNMRFGDEDQARLNLLSAHYEMTAAQVIRMLIKRDVEALQIGGAQRDGHRWPSHAAEPPADRVPVTAPARPSNAAKARSAGRRSAKSPRKSGTGRGRAG